MVAVFWLSFAGLAACADGDDGEGPQTYAVGGTIVGYTGQGLLLASPGLPDIAVTAGATEFTFGEELPKGASYDVSVVAHPSAPGQLCAVANGEGTVSRSDVRAVRVDCGALEGDAVTFRRILDGELTPEAGLLEISRSGGLPIETSVGFIFAVSPSAGTGRPGTLTSPNGRFATVRTHEVAGMAWALVKVTQPDGARYEFLTSEGSLIADRFARCVAVEGPSYLPLVRSSAPHLELWRGIGEGLVAARTLRVWVHPGTTPTHAMYAHDGQAVFGPGGGSWPDVGGWSLETVALPSTLVVGIDDGDPTVDWWPNRFDEYTDVEDACPTSWGCEGLGTVGGDGDAYTDYVADTVLPFIEARYGTVEHRGIMGASLGGVISYLQELNRPGDFDVVASVSGTMGWGSVRMHNPTLIEQYAALSACPPAAFYLDSGGSPGLGCLDVDLDGIFDDAGTDNHCENVQLKGVLESLGCDVTYRWLPGAGHDVPEFRLRAPAIFALLEAL